MNHIYKTVWNAGLGAWVAVGELTKAHGKTKNSRAASSRNGASAKRRRSAALLLAAGLSTIALPVLADTWSNTGTGNWAVGGNWGDGTAPTSGDNAFINNGGTAVVTTPGAVASGVTVGDTATGALDILTGGTLSTDNATSYIGYDAGSTGTGTVDGIGSSWTNSNSLYVGNFGTGTLTIRNGGAVSNDYGYIGRQSGSIGTVTVDGIGSSWTDSGDLSVGEMGTGTLTISNGGAVSNVTGLLGYGAGSTGTVTVDGSGSSWTNSNSLYVGRRGTGTLTISNGGAVSNVTGLLGYETGSTGTGTVDGIGSSWTTSSKLYVGTFGTGTLTISNGGAVSNDYGYIGFGAGSTGTGTVDGIGSSWTNSSNLYVGNFGTGTLTISNGGTVNVNSGAGAVYVGYDLDATGTLNIGAEQGQTAVAAGTLNAGTVAFGNGVGTLVFNHTDTGYSFNPAVAGTGAIGLYSGTTRFTGNLSAYSGTMTVDGGTLALTAGQTLSMAGDYVQTANGTLRVDVTDDTTYGKLVANAVTLPSNAKIDVNVANPNFSFTATSMADIISASTLNSDGTFSVTDNSALFNFGAVKDGNTVDLTIAAAGGGGIEEIVIAQGNQPATGAARALDTIIASDPSGPVASLFVPFTTDEQVNTAVSQTLPLLTGGSQVAASTALTGINRVVQARIESNRGLSSGDVFYGDKKFWMKPFGSWADQDDRKGVSGYKASTAGLAFGADATVSDQTRLGLSFAYAKASVDGNSSVAPNTAQVDVYQLVGYGSHALGQDTELNFQVGIGQNKNEGKRHLTSFGLTAAAEYSSLTATAGAGLGRTYSLGEATRFTPSIRADYTWIKDKGYTETGAGALNLNVRGRTSDELILAVDGKVAHQIDAGTTLTANLGIGYDVLSKQSSITAAFAGAPGVGFTTQGLDPSPWLVRGGVGMVKTLQSGMELTVRYDVEYRQGFLNQTASVKARWVF